MKKSPKEQYTKIVHVQPNNTYSRKTNEHMSISASPQQSLSFSH